MIEINLSLYEKMLKNYRKIGCLILFAFAFCISLSAQDEGFIKGSEKTIYKSDTDTKAQCFVFDKYVVKTFLKDNTKDGGGDGTGYDLTVFIRDAVRDAAENCGLSVEPSTNIKNEEGNEAGGVFGDLFFVRRNVFPDGADLDIYDLKTHKVIFTTAFSEWDNYRMNISGGRFLNYRQWSKKDGLLKNCPQAKKWKRDGFGISWLQTRRFDLRTRKETSVGALRCINVQ